MKELLVINIGVLKLQVSMRSHLDFKDKNSIKPLLRFFQFSHLSKDGLRGLMGDINYIICLQCITIKSY